MCVYLYTYPLLFLFLSCSLFSLCPTQNLSFKFEHFEPGGGLLLPLLSFNLHIR